MAQSLLRPPEVTQRARHFGRREKVLGQFFTPPEVAEFIIAFAELHAPRGGSACDPACGDGVFLDGLRGHGFSQVTGIDVDTTVLATVPESIQGEVDIVIVDALKKFSTLETRAKDRFRERFDVVVGNPPFSSKYGRISLKPILSTYLLGRGRKSQAVEILFLERFIEMTKPGGFIGIVLPDGPFVNTGLENVRRFVLDHVTPLAILSLPRNIFRSEKSTTSKTSILLAKKTPYNQQAILMAHLESLEDLPQVRDAFLSRRSNRVAFWRKGLDEASLHPTFYKSQRTPLEWKVPAAPLSKFIVKMSSGATLYGKERRFAKAGIPYTSAKAVTWHGIDFSRDGRFVKLGSPMDIQRGKTRVGDLLFVRVGVGCSGRAAVVADERDTGIADDWIYLIRVKDVSPFYVALFMATSAGTLQIEAMKRGTGTVTIPQRLLKNLQIPMVNHAIQKQCEEIYLEMVRQKRAGFTNGADNLLLDAKKTLERAMKLDGNAHPN